MGMQRMKILIQEIRKDASTQTSDNSGGGD